ncbi:MAG: 16S rRNA processing protein RimM [Lachnospiraceae bacterium]|nr:16S rRNA processing protein RimM [Lachnospiraceae bacterium]MBR3231806.1 16S rRNA processing protein RimM [Lachnospiraceae bacterium]MBR6397295.1 16S rRNA processing protein RimM [Lachnospiraceae bacterium]
MLEKLQVGVIASMHGLKGEVNVFPTTDDANRFTDLKSVFIEEKGIRRDLEIESVRYFKGRPIVKFRGLDRIEDVQKMKGAPLLIDRKDAVPLAPGEYFIGDLVGCTVYLEDGSELGVMKDVLQTGANDVYVIEKKDGNEILVPKIPDCVKELTPEEGRIVVHLLPEI